MIHLGDITKIDGKRIDPVDVIVGGSPCQDLSVAGKRAGLAGERSGLFMEQIRLTKELRQQDAERGKPAHLCRPRYFIWENVPGAFSSKKGEDFAAVLEEVIQVIEPKAPSVSVPEKGWPTAGCIYDDMGRWSVAWRVHDAQFWGVLQRRRRIALVADFGGLSAPEVLFERKGLRWDTAQSGKTRQGAAADAKDCTGADDRAGESAGAGGDGRLDAVSGGFCPEQSAKTRGIGWEEELPHTLTAGAVPGVVSAVTFEPGIAAREGGHIYEGVCGTLRAEAGDNRMAVAYTLRAEAHGNVPAVVCKTYDARGNGDGDTISTITGDHENRVTDYTALCIQWNESQIGATLRTPSGGDATNNDMLIAGIDARNGVENGDLCGTLQAKPNGGFSYNCIHPVRINKHVRRLTPLECERLQGYPDGWTDIGEWVDSKGKRHDSSDSARYKALGNSIALPFWHWLLKRISAQYVGNPTLGSLFDGIGGFPLCWERINGKGTALWASEIEEFPIAVTKYHFGG